MLVYVSRTDKSKFYTSYYIDYMGVYRDRGAINPKEMNIKEYNKSNYSFLIKNLTSNYEKDGRKDS